MTGGGLGVRSVFFRFEGTIKDEGKKGLGWSGNEGYCLPVRRLDKELHTGKKAEKYAVSVTHRHRDRQTDRQTDRVPKRHVQGYSVSLLDSRTLQQRLNVFGCCHTR